MGLFDKAKGLAGDAVDAGSNLVEDAADAAGDGFSTTVGAVDEAPDWIFSNTLDHVIDLTVSGRPLTDNEITMLKDIFGDSINYDSVEIQHGAAADILHDIRGTAGLTITDDLISIKGDSYSDDFTLNGAPSLLVHEMTHIWQKQNGMHRTLSNAFSDAAKGDSAYDYELEPGKELSDYSSEQQAEIIEGYFALVKSNYISGHFTNSGEFSLEQQQEIYEQTLESFLADNNAPGYGERAQQDTNGMSASEQMRNFREIDRELMREYEAENASDADAIEPLPNQIMEVETQQAGLLVTLEELENSTQSWGQNIQFKEWREQIENNPHNLAIIQGVHENIGFYKDAASSALQEENNPAEIEMIEEDIQDLDNFLDAVEEYLALETTSQGLNPGGDVPSSETQPDDPGAEWEELDSDYTGMSAFDGGIDQWTGGPLSETFARCADPRIAAGEPTYEVAIDPQTRQTLEVEYTRIVQEETRTLNTGLSQDVRQVRNDASDALNEQTAAYREERAGYLDQYNEGTMTMEEYQQARGEAFENYKINRDALINGRAEDVAALRENYQTRLEELNSDEAREEYIESRLEEMNEQEAEMATTSPAAASPLALR